MDDTVPPVITLFEAYGAGADEVGPRLAEALGVRWVGQSVTIDELEAADARGAGRINARQFVVSSAMTDVGSTQLVENPGEAIVQRQASEAAELAATGAVILGRNATLALAGRPRTLHVKLDADPRFRVRRAASIEGVTEAQADLRRRREDAARAELSLETWHWDPRATSHFDLVVDTRTFGSTAPWTSSSTPSPASRGSRARGAAPRLGARVGVR